MGKKEYEHAAAYVRRIREGLKDKPNSYLGGEPDYDAMHEEGSAQKIEDAFVDLFTHFDSKGRFNNQRFRAACKAK